jgi:predicted HTH transcriptional regulator
MNWVSNWGECLMKSELIIVELVKLALQFPGALIVARLAVKWALSRYKSEKTWERQLSAYADAVTSVSEMRLVVGRWIDEEIESKPESEDSDTEHLNRYRTARRQLEEGLAAAVLILPEKTSAGLKQLMIDIDTAPRAESYLDHLEGQYSLLSQASKALIEQGRKNLGLGSTEVANRAVSR